MTYLTHTHISLAKRSCVATTKFKMAGVFREEAEYLVFLPRILRASGRLSLTSQVGCFQDTHRMDATSDLCALMPA